MKISSLFALAVSVLFASGAYAELPAEGPPPEAQPVTLGAILSLTGDVAPFGEAIQQGMELALADGSAADFRIVYEDDRSISKVAAVNAARKLADIDHAPVVLNMVASTAASIAPVLKGSNSVGIIVWDSNEEISKLGDWMIGMGYGTEAAAEGLAEFTIKNLHAKRIAVLSALDDWAAVYSGAFKSKVAEMGGEIVFAEAVNPDESNFKTLIARIRAVNAEATVGVLYTGALVSWIRQSSAQGFKGSILTADAVSATEVKEAGPAAEGLYASQIWVEDKELESKYAAKFGTSADRLRVGFVSIGYDAVRCLSKLKADLASRELPFAADTVKDGLVGFSCPGVAGKFTISPQRLSDKKERIVVVKEGRFELSR